MRYPLFLDLSGRRVLVVGAGAVAARRARGLKEAGAHVIVVAPDVGADVAADEVVRRPFEPGDVDGSWLVLACTDDADVNAVVAAAAAERGIWCVRADRADESAAWVPATGGVDDIQVAVSAGGDPGRARDLRDGALRALHAGEWHARRGRRGSGRVVLVGGGPGDPGLLTLSGFRALLDADVVVTDRLGPAELVGTLPADVEVVDVGKDPRGHAASQDDINALLVDRARQGQVVVRLKGGDPFVFGRGGEEWLACVAAGVPVTVVPGLTSAIAGPSAAQIPLTHRGVAADFTVVSGHLDPGRPADQGIDWPGLAAHAGTLVLLMAMDRLGLITKELIEHGMAPETPSAVVQKATLAEQRVLRARLDDIASLAQREGIGPPAVVVIGEVVDVLA